MSKKSRKRNKKILAALALAGGAAMLAKGRGKGIDQGVSGADKAAFTSDAAYSPPIKPPVIRKDVLPKIKPRKKIDHGMAYQSSRAAGDYPDLKVAPTRVKGVQIKGRTYEPPIPFHPAQGNVRPTTEQILRGSDRRNWKGGGIAKRGNGAAYKSGGRTGKQFGGGLNRPVARPIGGVGAPVRPVGYKHGGTVKSMGVAKRGGGIAKR